MRQPKGFLFLDRGSSNPATGRAVRWKNNCRAFIGSNQKKTQPIMPWLIENTSQFSSGLLKKAKIKK
jgi:hypothetical protein